MGGPTALRRARAALGVSSLAAVCALAGAAGDTIAGSHPDWVNQPIGGDIVGESRGDAFGTALDLSADGITAVVGAPLNSGAAERAGHVRVFDLEGTADRWVQRGPDLDGTAAGDNLGSDVAISADGDTVVAGAPDAGVRGALSGYVRIVDWDTGSDTWVQRGADITAGPGSQGFGRAVDVSADGDTIVVGAARTDEMTTGSGAVRVLDWDAGSGEWTRRGTDVGAVPNVRLGVAVAISADGETIAVGAPGVDNARGEVRVLDWSDERDRWEPRGAPIAGESRQNRFGFSVDLSADGATVATGAPDNTDAGTGAGHVRVVDWNETAGEWEQRGTDLDGVGAGDRAGLAVAVSGTGDSVVVGAPTNGAGRARILDWDAIARGWVARGPDLSGDSVGDEFGGAVATSADGSTVIVGAVASDGLRGLARAVRTEGFGLPGAPSSVAAAAPRPAEADLTWSPPDDATGGRVGGYVVQQSVDGGATWTNAATDTIAADAANATVVDLSNGAPVIFRVLARNVLGIGPASPSSDPVTPTTPPLPIVEPAPGRSDPASTTPIEFVIAFDQPVGALDTTAVTVSGSARPAAITAERIAANSFVVTVGSVQRDGTVVVDVAPGATVNENGQGSLGAPPASVTFDTTGPVATVDLAPGQGSTVTATPIEFAVHFDEAVGDFELRDVEISGTAQVGPVALRPGSGPAASYVVEVSSVDTPGTVTIGVRDGAATDAAGNPSSTVVIADTVTVEDLVGPTLDLPADIRVDNDPGADGAVVEYSVTASDPPSTVARSPFGAAITPMCTPESGSRFEIGSTPVTCTATDAAGNSTTGSFQIRVDDVEAPVFTSVPGPIEASVPAGTTSFVLDYPSPTATDNHHSPVVICRPPSGSTIGLGTTAVDCTAADASGNTAAASFTATVTSSPDKRLPTTGDDASRRATWLLLATAALAVGILVRVAVRR